MDRNYYGAELDGIHAISTAYGVDTPQELYDALLKVWCAATCSPRMRENWSTENPTLGQCAITAVLAQDIFGGEIYGICLPDGGVHCYNVVEGKTFDLTSEQFGAEAEKLSYEGNKEVLREAQLADPEKNGRYELLKKGLLSL